MRLSTFSDYALRLMMLASSTVDRLVTIEEAAVRYNVSKAHLMKVANMLTSAGYLEAVRGRNGGLRLARQPHDIRLGDLVRATEPDLALVECYRADGHCPVTAYCRLPPVLNDAIDAFFATLNQKTLADVMLPRVPADSGLRRKPVPRRKTEPRRKSPGSVAA